MSLVDVDSWLLEYEACVRLSLTILAQSSQREQRPKASDDYNRLTSCIHVGLKQFETELKLLKDKLNLDRSLNFEETERRQRQVDTLQSQLQQLKWKNTNKPDSLWQNTSIEINDAPIIDPTDVQAFKRRQVQMIEDQNRGLETLSQTISRQRNLASQLGQEVEDQNNLLGNIADTMERVDAGVHAETGNIGRVNRTDSTWSYWIVILVLFVVIVIVALI